jgi:hydroxymethylbilane synthase
MRLGSRGSALALWQAGRVKEAFSRAAPGVPVEIVVISTSGDRNRGALWRAGGKGLFIKELEEALLGGRVDLAVHSLKDVPSQLPEGLILASCLRRGDPRDALVSRKRMALEKLPPGARVGTSSPRREAQLRRLRPDVRVVPLRGNVPTRVAKVREGALGAAVLALAGLRRLGLEKHAAQRFSASRMIPAVGQGIVVMECRKNDLRCVRLLRRLRHEDTWNEMQAERAFLAAMQGDCRSPLAALARLRGGRLRMRAMAASLDGRRMLRVSGEDSAAHPAVLGRRLARKLLAQGASALIAESREAMKS